MGRYRIVARLGAGGMGRVYLARSPGERLFAVKVVRPELAEGGDFRRRFAREVAAARRVSGAFTAAVVDAAPDASPPWLATVYVPGIALGEAVLRHGPWPARPVLALGAGLAEALEAIHSAGIVHRDLKPSNILLAADGPRVIDFGISFQSEASKLTQTGMVFGTPGFMSPEQLTGHPVGPASDVFALGAVLAYTAMGTGPFGTGAPHALHYRAVHEQPCLASLPTDLRTVVSACLAKPPEQRPTVAALLHRLTTAGGTRGDTSAVMRLLAEPGWMPAQVARLVRDQTNPALLRTPPVATQPDANASAAAPSATAAGTAAPDAHRGRTMTGRRPAPAPEPASPPIAHSHPRLLPVALSAALLLVLGSVLYVLKEQPWRSGTQTHSADRPGCDRTDAAVSWRAVDTTSTCSSYGTTLRKLRDANGLIAENNAELQFRVSDRSFPSHYRLSVDVDALTEADPTAQGACAGFATHTNGSGTTFEELAVCSGSGTTGKFSLIKVLHGTEIDRDEKPLPPGGGPFNLTADVSADTVTFSVRASGGQSSSLRTTAVASTTSHVGLTVFWKTAGAHATFSNFRYEPR
ncbi:serine/threonine protein kinase [Streptomyces spectabilis]|uniref:Serine/threonine protein kinase n=1 Tax=Streptomyces spectabilis TaxID=68270 RepID=A0A5P2XIR5_STRST|nr:serine/threonine protein kinase [Streptomyces spectabilis]